MGRAIGLPDTRDAVQLLPQSILFIGRAPRTPRRPHEGLGEKNCYDILVKLPSKITSVFWSGMACSFLSIQASAVPSLDDCSGKPRKIGYLSIFPGKIRLALGFFHNSIFPDDFVAKLFSYIIIAGFLRESNNGRPC